MIKEEGNTIGVELTEVFQDSTSKHSRLQQKSSDWASFTDQLILAIQPHIWFKFTVGIHFSNFHPIRKAEKENFIQTIATVCIPHLRGLLNRLHLRLDYYNGLPEQIDSIYFGRFDGIEESYNYKPEGGPVSDLRLEHSNPIIRRKEEKLLKYAKWDQYWLLIREGNYYAGSFSEVDITEPLQSSFDKVFLIRTTKDEIIQLK